ncbi:DNA polymerase III subunit gamma and tau [Microbacterium sp. RU33B]|uniref:DNA polymerase III subunit gamma and tau n=1 Tax=Microbacterium sp. RU33B TaxID=1907390 RepID=UPI000958E8A7|nr:DNA polymerase III subunit gamma and tau [Microbacterium sp. RU33B]SIT69496.1 DNA polymerase-3 subunit gamma/tau [Microbacterium sp. RU33B]
MTTALYRRYRPEAFGEMIGQAQVTDPLMTALRSDRVGHAYLFSGPRGCGKTTSARILARCLNCAQGPTDTPCGVCDSCVELGRGGGGSLDVVEIDAASHNGVDDARDLRERAIFAPARDRFKIFILDEAHMVTPQGFNALLKLVEEPPDHVKFIFATTEPEKVIGTIRSRTHHYPFRLVPPAAMLEYVQELCQTEGVEVEAGVLPLVVRAGGGSPRDTLSLLDQLIAGSEDAKVTYSRAVALLGYTHGELLDEVVDAFAARDAAAAFAAVDRVVQTGQDPRRFVDDLLERLRDLIIIAATGQGASAVLRGVSAEDLARMGRQADLFGATRLSRTADLVVTTLDEMSGATSPRLQLELMVARVLASHVAVAEPAAVSPAPVAPTRASAPEASAPAATVPAAPAPVAAPPAVPALAEEPSRPAAAPAPAAQPALAPVPSVASGPITLQRMRDSWPEVLGRLEGISRSSWMLAMATQPLDLAQTADGYVLTLAFQSARDIDKFKPKALGGTDAHVDVRQAITDVLGIEVRFLPRVEVKGDDVAPPSDADAPDPDPDPDPEPPAESAPVRAPERPSPRTESVPPPAPRGAPASARPAAVAPVTEWAVAPIPTDGPPAPSVGQFAVDDEPEEAASPVITATLTAPREGDVLPARDLEPAISLDDELETDDLDAGASVDVPVPPVVAPRLPVVRSREDGVRRYGEAVVRQVLGATFVREEPYEPPTRFS